MITKIEEFKIYESRFKNRFKIVAKNHTHLDQLIQKHGIQSNLFGMYQYVYIVYVTSLRIEQ